MWHKNKERPVYPNFVTVPWLSCLIFFIPSTFSFGCFVFLWISFKASIAKARFHKVLERILVLLHLEGTQRQNERTRKK